MPEDPFSPDLDRIDRNILRALQKDARMANSDLAQLVNVSAATCHRRTQRLIERKYISSVRAQIAPASVGLGTLVMVGVVLDRSTPESFTEFEETVAGMKEVLDCNLVAGDFDYLLKIRTRDMEGFNLLHSRKLITLPGVRQIRTFFVLKEVKDNAPLAF